MAQQLEKSSKILCFELCCLSGISSRHIFQIQELSFRLCDHSTCQTPDSSHWWSSNIDYKRIKPQQVTFGNKGSLQPGPQTLLSPNQHSRTERPGKYWLQIRKISHSRLNCACLLFYFWSFSLLFRPIKIDPATELSRVTRLRRKEVRAWPSLKSEKVLYSDQIGI